jgi:uncharacterized protein YggE
MKPLLLAALLLGAATVPAAAEAQQSPNVNQSIAGTRLDLSVTGESTRVPDLAIISAGVLSKAPTAAGAIRDNATRMERVIAALRSAGIAERDIQTNSVSLNPEYVYENNKAPRLTGYTANNTVTIRFRDILNSGKVLDVLVAQGANQINGPNLVIEKPAAALDEARANAVAIARARAEIYARSLGMRVARVVSVTEGGSYYAPPPPPPPAPERDGVVMAMARTQIVPGEQKLQVTLGMVFELQ